MPRPKSFDPQQALQQMVQVFWECGYEGTSISALEAATGLNKRSLYNTFGDKAQIFSKVLDTYGAMMSGGAAVLQREPQCIDNVVAYFEGIAASKPNGLGCLFTKSVNERCITEPDAFDKVKGALLSMEGAFIHNLKPELGARTAKRVARFLTVTVQGITTMTRIDSDPGPLRGVINTVLRLLEAERAARKG